MFEIVEVLKAAGDAFIGFQVLQTDERHSHLIQISHGAGCVALSELRTADRAVSARNADADHPVPRVESVVYPKGFSIRTP